MPRTKKKHLAELLNIKIGLLLSFVYKFGRVARQLC
jgi:hypothetical protein